MIYNKNMFKNKIIINYFMILKNWFSRISIYKRKIGFDDRILKNNNMKVSDSYKMDPKEKLMSVYEI